MRYVYRKIIKTNGHLNYHSFFATDPISIARRYAEKRFGYGGLLFQEVESPQVAELKLSPVDVMAIKSPNQGLLVIDGEFVHPRSAGVPRLEDLDDKTIGM